MSTPFPSSLFSKIANSKLTLRENKASTESLFTRKRQVTLLTAGTSDRWEGMLQTVRLLSSSDMLDMWAFLMQVGLYGQFTIGDPDYSGPISAQSSCLVMGGGQSGTSLAVDGLTASVIALRAGEYFQIGTEFKVMIADATANGSGQATLLFKPALRSIPADNAAVTLASPQLLVLLTSAPEKETDNLKSAAFVLSFEEAL